MFYPERNTLSDVVWMKPKLDKPVFVKSYLCWSRENARQECSLVPFGMSLVWSRRGWMEPKQPLKERGLQPRCHGILLIDMTSYSTGWTHFSDRKNYCKLALFSALFYTESILYFSFYSGQSTGKSRVKPPTFLTRQKWPHFLVLSQM